MEHFLKQEKCVSIIRNGFLAYCLVFSAVLVFAHEIPDRVQVRILILEDGQELNLLARLPLEAMRDIDFSLRGPGYLNFSESLPQIKDAINLWLLDEITLYQNNSQLTPEGRETVRISLPSNRAFKSYETALAHVSSEPLTDDIDLFWRQAYVDLHVTYPLLNNDPLFFINANLSGLGLRTISTLEFTNREGIKYQYDIAGDADHLSINPDRLSVVSQFFSRGVIHLLEGTDHLLFLLMLAIPIAGFWPLIQIALAFALGHSITLVLATYGIVPDFLWFPTLVELLISLGILILAIDNVFKRARHWRWVVGLLFGLMHGFAFSDALSHTMQYSGNYLLMALLGFNLGVDFAQALVLIGTALAYAFLRRYTQSERLLLGIISLLVGHTSLHWIHEHWVTLSAYM